MKRTPLARKTALKRATTPMKKSGETKRKKTVRQKSFYSSAAWKKLRKEALARAGWRCEYKTQILVAAGAWFDGEKIEIYDGIRCIETERLQVHHKRGSLRFGGDELPEDLEVLCQHHHAIVEQRDFPHRTHTSLLLKETR